MLNLRPWRGLAITLAIVLLLNAAVLYAVLGEPAVDPGSLRMSQGPEIATLDPGRMKALADGRIASSLFEGLTVTDPATLAARPGVAQRWDVSADGLEYTFHLRPDARWSDGSAVTAEDFIYSWRRVLTARTAAPYKYMLYPIKGAEAYAKASEAGDEVLPELGMKAQGDNCLQVTLERTTPYFLSLTSFSTYLPVKREVVEKGGEAAGDEQLGWTAPDKIVSNGAYVLSEWVYSDRMVLRKNRHYWNADAIRINEVRVLPMTSDAAYVAYEKGQLDMVTDVPALAAEALARRQAAGRRPDVYLVPNFGTYYYKINCRQKPLNDVRVRRALLLAIDKRAIIEKVGRLNQREAGSFVPPGVAGYEGAEAVERNVEEARRLLSEAGYPGGKGFPRLTLLYNTHEGHRNAAELAMQSWKQELGIEVALENMEWKVFLEEVQKGGYHIARSGWYGDYIDPNSFLDLFVTDGGNNDTGWSNERYDELIRKAAETVEKAERAAMLREAEQILNDQGPIIPVYYYNSMILVRPHVKGFSPNLRNEILFGDLWIDAAGGKGKAAEQGEAAPAGGSGEAMGGGQEGRGQGGP